MEAATESASGLSGDKRNLEENPYSPTVRYNTPNSTARTAAHAAKHLKEAFLNALPELLI